MIKIIFPNYFKCLLLLREGHELLLHELLNAIAPVQNDITLKNLQIDEILQIIVKMVIILEKLMKPMSVAVMEFRIFLLSFAEIFYDEREPDRIQNEKLNFSKLLNFLNPEYNTMRTMYHNHMLSPEETYLLTVFEIWSAIGRLNSYLKNVIFIKKK